MRWILIGLSVGICLFGTVGCRAKHQAVESANVDIRDEAAIRVERNVSFDAMLERIDNLVVERPEIVVHDGGTGTTVTVRGERLARERRENAVTEQTEHCKADSTTAGILHATADRSSKTEGKGGTGMWYIPVVVIAVWVLTWLKKSGCNW